MYALTFLVFQLFITSVKNYDVINKAFIFITGPVSRETKILSIPATAMFAVGLKTVSLNDDYYFFWAQI